MVDVVKHSSFGGCLVVALTRKGRTQTFMRDENVEIKPYDAFQSIGPSPDSKTPF